MIRLALSVCRSALWSMWPPGLACMRSALLSSHTPRSTPAVCINTPGTFPAAAQALAEAAAAQERAAMAEQAKIELTLALAEAAEARAKDVDTHTTTTPPVSRDAGAEPDGEVEGAEGWGDADWNVDDIDMGELQGGDEDTGSAADATAGQQKQARRSRKGSCAGGGSGFELPPGATVVQASEMEALLTRAQEAELAAAVQTRRAAAAELEVDGLRKRLAEAEKQVKDLGWQVQMMADPTTIGGMQRGGPRGPGQPGGPGWFADMLGCGANYVRK